MKILFLLPDFPFPPSTGGRSKVFNELSYLSRRHHCDLLCIGDAEDKQRRGLKAALPNVRLLNVVPGPSFMVVFLRNMLNVFRLLPYSLARFTDKRFVQEVTASLAAEKYDVIHYDIVNMAQHLSLGKGIPSVHSPNDATSLAYSRLAQQTPWSFDKFRLLLSAVLLRRYEKRIYPRFTKIHVVSEVDAAYLRQLNPKIDIAVIPIALDVDKLKVKAYTEETSGEAMSDKWIVCTGNFENTAISYGAEDFIDEAFPLILNKMPGARLKILGKNASDKLLEKIHRSDKIEYIEWVEDYNEFLSQAGIVLAPDYAGAPGAKTRVLQAMGLGLPVIGTSPAFEGIPIIKGKHGLVYASMPECAQMMMDLLANHDQWATMGKAGYDLVTNEFSLQVIGPKYENLYLDAICSYS